MYHLSADVIEQCQCQCQCLRLRLRLRLRLSGLLVTISIRPTLGALPLAV